MLSANTSFHAGDVSVRSGDISVQAEGISYSSGDISVQSEGISLQSEGISLRSVGISVLSGESPTGMKVYYFSTMLLSLFSKSCRVVVQSSITEQGGGLINGEELEPSGLFLSRPPSNEKLRETGKLRRETEITRLNLAFRQMEVAGKNQP